ncbi:lysophospholipid acyltransferase family protein [Luedemannella helvata]|uniref:Lysophospholipid acyltransferase family protein n=1 Tax=Luedemannella helvata TaxID=349315 RepID=A0ABN2L358_9ACTN
MAKRRIGFWRRFAVSVVKPPMVGLTARNWRGMEHIPPTGPLILVANHISHADPFVLAHYVYDAGRWPGFLAKASVFRLPVAGRILHKVGQIPVYRGTVDAAKALDAAVGALRAGEAVLIYPEGTITREPELWPMRGKTGVARLWLTTGAPVVPVAMWGPEKIFDPHTRKVRLRPRMPVTVVAGPPIDLSRWTGVAPTSANLHEITDHIMGVLRDMVEDIRGGQAPPLWSPAAGREATS